MSGARHRTWPTPTAVAIGHLAPRRAGDHPRKMPRPPRDRSPGFHHVGVSASGPAPYFRDVVDHIDWIRRFAALLDRWSWRCLAFCQLTTHWHALVEVADDSLSTGMHWLNAEYSKAFNARHGRVGYLVRDRFWSRRKASDEALLTAYRYVVANPVRAGIVDRAADWPWSSFATTIGSSDAFPFVDASPILAIIGDDQRRALRALRQFVDGGSPSRSG
jgi:REP-associated tyrosine transposase